MKKENFLRLKEELTELVVEYEILQRKSYFIQQSYLIEFHEALEEEFYLKMENDVLINAIKMSVDGASDHQIEEYLKTAKEETEAKHQTFQKNYQQALDTEKRCRHYTPEDMKALDELFASYCVENHPMIKANCTDAERAVYNTLIMTYRMGNIEGVHAILKEAESIFEPALVEEKEYDLVGAFYHDCIVRLKNLLNQCKNTFPLNKSNIVDSYDGATQEHGILRESNYNLRKINQNLHKDYQMKFEKDWNII